MKKMSKRAAWKYLAKLWSSPINHHGTYFVKVFGSTCFGLCHAVERLEYEEIISTKTMAQMLADMSLYAPKEKYCGYRWSYISINGAKARSRFCLKMAERK